MSKQKTAMQIAIDRVTTFLKNCNDPADNDQSVIQALNYVLDEILLPIKANEEREQLMKGDILACALRGMTADESRKTAERYYNETYGDNT